MSVVDAFDRIAPLLSRRPDVEGHDLVAADRSDRVLLAEAECVLEGAGEIVVIGDRYGALSLPLLAADPARRVRVHQDPVTGERALAANAERIGIGADRIRWHDLDEPLAQDARLALLQLPRGLDALDEIAGVVADHASDEVTLIAVGRVKDMTPAMNDVLARHFGEVRASRGVGKSRALTARRPIRGAGEPWPRTRRHDDAGLTLVAHGAAFGGANLDRGTRLLLAHTAHMPSAESVIDLGCGTGAIATAFALARPGSHVIATDRSSAAVASAAATAEVNGVGDRVHVVRDAGLSRQPDASADLVLLNPPFHAGSAVTTGIAHALFADAARVLRPGGELWCVWNSHLRYRSALERAVGSTRQIARDRTFTVTASRRR